MKEYLEAPPEIEQLAKKVMKKHRMQMASEAKIKYIFKMQRRSGELSYTSRCVGHWRFLMNFDFVIVLWSEWWAAASPKDQEALMYHALLHITRNPNTGFWEVRYHNIECFSEEIVEYGAWHPSLIDLSNIIKAAKKSR